MPEILEHSNRLAALKQRSKDVILERMREWQFADIVADENALVDGLLAALFAEVPGIMADAIREGERTGETILSAYDGKPHTGGDYDFQKYVDAALNDLQRDALLIANQFAENLQAEVERLRGQDVGDDQIFAQFEQQDWLREHRGLVSSRLWAGLPRVFSGTAARIYQLASLAIRYSQQVGV